MEMHHVKYFLALCDTLNFTRAAEKCNVSQPSLTRAIKQLEEELGGQLVRRERSSTHLTDFGDLMRERLTGIQDAHMAALSDAQKFQTKDKVSLTLGVMSTINPNRLITFFEALNRKLHNLDLELSEGPGTQLVDDLVSGRIDVAIVGMPNYPEKFRVRRLFTERYAVAFPDGHRFQNMNAVPLMELNGEDYLARVHCEFRHHFETLKGGQRPQPNVRLHSEREDWVQALVLAAMGVSIMPENNILLTGLKTRLLVEPEISRTISLVDLGGRPYEPALQHLIRLAETFDWD